jgi:HK97 family phage prohead protease
VSGYGIVFNSDSLPLVIHDRSNGFVKVYERITRESIQEADMTDVIAAFNHNFEKLMGRTTSNTLQLSIDDKGVFYSFEAPPTQAGDDLLTHLQRKEISGSSFTFTIDAEEGYDIIERGDGSLEATPKRITKIYEMGPVINPAYPMTTAENRSQGLFDAVTSHLNRKVEEDNQLEERKQDDAELLKAKAELELFVIENC